MLFWKDFRSHGEAVAIIDGPTGASWSYTKLAEEVERRARSFGGNKSLVLLPLDAQVDDVLTYFSVLFAGHAIYPYNAQTSSSGLQGLISYYRPDVILGWAANFAPPDYYYEESTSCLDKPMARRRGNSNYKLNEELALLLSTSGSTGTRKLVRLSSKNIDVNANQITNAIHLSQVDRAITTLPLTYIYGLSVLHSHLSVGASVVVEPSSVVEKKYWKAVHKHRVSTISGVPWTYEMMIAGGLSRLEFPTLKRFTLSGGIVGKRVRDWLEGEAKTRGSRIYYMYGQTEAAGRIAVLPPELILQKPRSVGNVVPGGKIECTQDGTVIYRGPNVMLGYCSSVCHLELGDTLKGVLDTGDIGYVDSDGHLFLTGRKSRISKVYGVRINLDEVQLFFDGSCQIKCDEKSGRIEVLVTAEMQKEVENLLPDAARHFGIPKSALSICLGEGLTRSLKGKMVAATNDILAEGGRDDQ